MKKILKLLFHRIFLIGFLIFLQASILIFIIIRFSEYFIYFYSFSLVLSMVVVLWILNNRSNPSYKIAWIIPIFLFPIFGGLFYLLFGGSALTRRQKRRMEQVGDTYIRTLTRNSTVVQSLKEENMNAYHQSHYISEYAYSPIYQNTYSEYYPIGEAQFASMIQELKQAKHYIFLEYFIIREGKMWNTILDILVEKARSGVDVRVIYDDFGCMMTLPYHYPKKLEALGIQCCIFNPFVPILSKKFNNRDHRKITVIDGHTGFIGGINLADEYINAFERFGHWKDSAVMLKGDAVWNLTVMFLSVWDYLKNVQSDFAAYRPEVYQEEQYQSDGYVQPFDDSPLDHETVGETVYLNLINKAEKYVYITSPYLVIDNEMVQALCIAAKSGIDVRIMTPYIPDKKYVHHLTRSYYQQLIESGVRIYEYTPGFIHAKNYVVDDLYAVVGTINMDYRSLYLHYECAVWLYRTQSVHAVYQDFVETLKLCREVTLEDCKQVKWRTRMLRSVLRLFAPLM